MDDRMREVYNYLSDNNYPPSYSMLQKLTLRRYASNFPFKIRIQEHELVLCPYNTGSHWIPVFAEQYLTSGSIDQVETSPASIRAQRLEIAGLLMENQVQQQCLPPGIEPTTLWLRVQSRNHYSTLLPMLVIVVEVFMPKPVIETQ
ncbi:UNVERIFIED_CONTAM: hypothetical protein FKN15_072091 [Acipenser sinensis]